MIDLATLGVIVDASQAGQAAAELNRFTAAGEKADNTNDRLTASSKKASASLREEASAATASAAAANATAGAFQNLNNQQLMAQRNAKLTANQMLNLSYQINDVVTGLISGQKPMMIFAQQGGQLFQIMQQGPGGLGGSMAALAKLIGPVGFGFAGLAVVMGTVAAAAANYDSAQKGLERTTYGMGQATGLAASQLNELAAQAASTGDISVAAARAMTSEYIRMGIAGSEVFTGLITLSRDYAAATGLKAKEANEELGESFADPIKGVETLNSRLNLLDDQTSQYIQTLVREGEIERAQMILLDELSKKVSNASDHVNIFAKAWHNVATGASNAWEALGKGSMRLFGDTGDANRAKAYSGFGYNPALEQVRASDEAAKREREANKAREEGIRLSRLAGEAARDLLPKEEKINKIRSQKVLIEKAVAKGQMDAATAARALAAADQQIADLQKVKGADAAGKKKQNEYQSAVKEAETYLANLKQERLEVGKTADQVKELRAERAAAKAPTEALAKAIRENGKALASEVEEHNRSLMMQRIANDEAQRRVQITAASYEAAKQEILAKGLKNEQTEREIRLLADAYAAGQKMTEELQFEASLLTMSTDARRVAVAERELETAGIRRGTAAWLEYRDAYVAASVKKQGEAFNIQEATAYLQLLNEVEQRTRSAAAGMADAFGDVGKSIGDMTVVFAEYAKNKEAISVKLAADEKKYAGDSVRLERARREASQAATAADLQSFGDLAGAAKSFFGEKTAAYRALEVAEKGYRAVQMGLAIKAMIMDKTETGSTVAQNAIKATSHGVVAVARALASLPFPLNLAAGAATAAAVAALGIHIAGGSRSGSAGPSAATTQASQGAGTTLGDSKAKSDSITKASEAALKNSNKDLEYSNQMVRSLRNIEGSIDTVAALISRQLGVAGGAFDTSGLGLGTTRNKGILGALPLIGGLFGSKTTTELLDQGLMFDGQSIADILANGLNGQSYQSTQSTTKKKLFGVTTSTKIRTNTASSALDADLENQLGLLVASLRDGVLAAATSLGVEGAAAVLDAFQVDIGKISFKDLTGEEIEAELNAVFGKLGDQLAGSAVPAVMDLQKVGEGAFATLVRVAREYQVVDVTLQSLSMTFGATGTASLKARQALVDLMGGLDNFTESAQFFAENFLTEAERMSPIITAVNNELSRLNLSHVNSLEGYKELVKGVDLTTETGRTMYAALMELAPAFFKVTEYLNELNGVAKAVDDDPSAIRSLRIRLMELDDALYGTNTAVAARREDELKTLGPLSQELQKLVWAREDEAAATERARQASSEMASLQIRLANAQGNTALAKQLQRTQELNNAANNAARAMLMQIYAAEDYQEAINAWQARVDAARDVVSEAYERESRALQTAADRLRNVSKSLNEFNRSLAAGELGGVSLAERFRVVSEEFDRVSALAASGDVEAMEQLEKLGREYLEVARDIRSNGAEYAGDVAKVRNATEAAEKAAVEGATVAEQQLEQLKKQVEGILQVNESVISLKDAIAQYYAALNAPKGGAGGAASGVGTTGGKYGGYAFDASSREDLKDGKFLPGDMWDPDFHDDLRRKLDAQRQATADMGYDAWAAQQNAIYDEGQDWLDSMWGGYKGAYKDAQDRMGGDIYKYDPNFRPGATEDAWRSAAGFATGGSFEVGGSAGRDRNYVGLRLTKGELVNVKRGDAANENSAMLDEMRSLASTMVKLHRSTEQMAVNIAIMNRRDQKWDFDGMPETRDVG